MQDLLNALLAHTGQQIQADAHLRFGIVDTFFQDGTASVRIQPEDILTGPLPINMMMVGDGLGIVVGLVPGTMVLCGPQEADSDNYAILGSFFHGQSPPPPMPEAIGGPPTAIRSGEVGVAATGGAVFRVGQAGIFMKGAVQIDGPLTVAQAITGQAEVSDFRGALDRLRAHYDSHVHTGVQSGTSMSGPTPQQG